MLDASRFLLSSENMDGADLRTVDPETQAKLEALLEAAGQLAMTMSMEFYTTKCFYLYSLSYAYYWKS